jgi:hypothetical protein
MLCFDMHVFFGLLTEDGTSIGPEFCVSVVKLDKVHSMLLQVGSIIQ